MGFMSYQQDLQTLKFCQFNAHEERQKDKESTDEYLRTMHPEIYNTAETRCLWGYIPRSVHIVRDEQAVNGGRKPMME